MNTSRLQLRELLARRQRLTDEQNSRLARRLHEEISQKLDLLASQLAVESDDPIEPPAQAKWSLRWSDVPPQAVKLEAKSPPGPVSPMSQKCRNWLALVNEISQAAREIADLLQPKVVDEFGLLAGLQWYERLFNDRVRCTVGPAAKEVVLPPELSRELFGICREILTRIYGPTETSRVDIQIHQVQGLLCIEFCGNEPKGLDALDPETELDIMSIKERLLRLGGTVEFSHVQQRGAMVTLRLPSLARGHPGPASKEPDSHAQSLDCR